MSWVFTVIGIGEVGSTVASLINSNFSEITIHLNDIQEVKNGRVLDLQHAGACNGNRITYNDPSAFEESDVIIFAAGFSNVHGESRNSVAARNRELVRSIFSHTALKPSATVLVITNPVEPVSYWIDECTFGRYKVIGTGTALDTFRLKYLLSERFKCKLDLIETMVIGEHGQHMVPLFSRTKVNGVPVEELVSQIELNAIEEELRQSAFQIRETEKGTKYGVAETTIYIIKAVTGDQECTLPVSIAYTNELSERFFISLPVKLNSGIMESIPFSMNSHENEKFQAAVSSIRSNLE